MQIGHELRLGLAGPLTDGLYVGLTGKYEQLRASTLIPRDSPLRDAYRAKSTLNLDAGLFWQLTRHVSIGGAAYNLVGSDKDATMPQEFGAGVAVGSETSLQLVADWRLANEACFTTDGAPAVCAGQPGVERKSASRYGGGLEYLLDGRIPVRGGFQVDEVSDTKWWSAGLGFVTLQAAIDVGFRQSLDRTDARTFMVSLRGFLPNE
jgi:hypothetical protein